MLSSVQLRYGSVQICMYMLLCCGLFSLSVVRCIFFFYYTHFGITGGPCNLIGSNWCNLFMNHTIVCFKLHLFPSQWEGYTKKKWKTKSITWQILQLLFSKFLFFPHKKWINLISSQLSTASMKYLNWPNPVFGRFQNGCNKVVIEPHVLQFLVWNHTFDFKSNSRHALVRFWNHMYDFSPNYTPLSSITIIK